MAESSTFPLKSTGDRWQPGWISLLAHLLLLVGAATAVFVAGRVHEGNLGAFLLLAGVALLVCPPQVRVDWKIVALGAALLLVASATLLPQAWFPEPEWRQRLALAAFPPVASVTPTPRETSFWLAVFSVAICVALFGQAHPLGSRGQLVLAVAAVLICGVYTGLAIYARQSGWEYPFAFNPGVFGFFPNRNHTASFLVVGCILALGILGVAFRGREWFAATAAAASLGIGATGLFFFSESRGGIVFLVAGTLLWLAGLGRAHRSRPLVISFAAIFAGGALLFLASQSTVRDRFVHLLGADRNRTSAPQPAQPDEAPGLGSELPTDGRVLIFRDTLGMIRDFPLGGSGLGTFRYVFPFYRERSLWDTPIAHPESDWLMLAAEAGIPALLLAALGVGWLLRCAWSMRGRPSWPLRWGILSAALAALMHGFVDVPAHRTALGWWILVMLGIGLQVTPRVHVRPSRVQHLLFILGGLGAIALGWRIVRAEWFGGPPSPPYAGLAAQTEIIGLRFEGKLDRATEAARRAIRMSPMTAPLYYQLGATLLESKAPVAEIDAVLLTQRLVNPIAPEVCIAQGALWLDVDPAKTAALWLEAVQRRERIDAARGGGKQGALALYQDLIRQMASNADAQRRLLDTASRGPDFALAWLAAAAPAVVAPELARLAADPAFLARLDEAGRRRFLRVWYDRGERAALFEFMENHQEWSAAGWSVRARSLVDSGKLEEAVKAAALHHKISLDLPPAGGGDAKPGAVDEANVAAAFDTYWRRGNVVSARRILDEARRGPAGGEPEVWRLSAALAAHDGQWPAAWQHLDRYLQHSGLDSAR